MTPLDLIAAAGAFVLLGIPLYWLVLHPFAAFWRRRRHRLAMAFAVASVTGWMISGAVVYFFSERLFHSEGAPLWARIMGLVLFAGEVVMFGQVTRAMGTERLIGKAEMSGAAQLETSGVYAWLRHPSYAGMMAAMVGICLLAWTAPMVAVAAGWLLLMRVMIAFEERELVARFGAAYEEYRRRVPALIPLRFGRFEK